MMCAFMSMNASEEHTCTQLMEEAFEAFEIWNALFSSIWPKKLVIMNIHSMAQSNCPGKKLL